MANLIRRHDPAEIASTGAWDPLRVMRDVLRWDPFREMERTLLPVERGFLPTFDVKESKDAYVFRADVPGVRDEDLDISLTGKRLTVSGTRQEEARDESETYYACERTYGSFTRSFTLPEGSDADNVKAEMKDGVLSLVVPKKPEVQAKRIQVRAAGVKDKPKA